MHERGICVAFYWEGKGYHPLDVALASTTECFSQFLEIVVHDDIREIKLVCNDAISLHLKMMVIELYMMLKALS